MLFAKDPKAVVLSETYERNMYGTKSQWFVTPGNRYAIIAILCYDGMVLACVMRDNGEPGFLPIAAFEPAHTKLEPDWSIRVFPCGWVVIGPKFMTESEDSYNKVLEGDVGKRAELNAYLRSIRGYP